MGNLQARTGIQREDEIGDLARSFDHMTESLQQLDQLKSEFVSHVSHELRTPLTSGKLSLANLEDEVLGPMTEKQKEVAGRIRKDIDRLIRMVNELLDIARLEAGKVEIHRQKVDLAEVITKTLETLQPLAAPRKIKISFASKPFPLEGDPSRLEQIFLNLVDNAIKHSPEGGEISIRTENRSLFIEDQGPGLPDEGKHLFEKFAPRKTGNQGVGLGLSITKKLVELHGGTILGETRAEGGSRFTVRFP
jgi:signal transduction histidine kinase